MCSPHYSHVIVKAEEGSDRAGGMSHGPSGGILLPSELSAACPEPGTWEIMVRSAVFVTWLRLASLSIVLKDSSIVGNQGWEKYGNILGARVGIHGVEIPIRTLGSVQKRSKRERGLEDDWP